MTGPDLDRLADATVAGAKGYIDRLHRENLVGTKRYIDGKHEALADDQQELRGEVAELRARDREREREVAALRGQVAALERRFYR